MRFNPEPPYDLLASRDWPFGSAIAMLAMVFVLTGLWVYARSAARKGEAELI